MKNAGLAKLDISPDKNNLNISKTINPPPLCVLLPQKETKLSRIVKMKGENFSVSSLNDKRLSVANDGSMQKSEYGPFS
jgi:hypothetical protein